MVQPAARAVHGRSCRTRVPRRIAPRVTFPKWTINSARCPANARPFRRIRDLETVLPRFGSPRGRRHPSDSRRRESRRRSASRRTLREPVDLGAGDEYIEHRGFCRITKSPTKRLSARRTRRGPPSPPPPTSALLSRGVLLGHRALEARTINLDAITLRMSSVRSSSPWHRRAERGFPEAVALFARSARTSRESPTANERPAKRTSPALITSSICG